MNGQFSEYVLQDLKRWRAEGKSAALLTLYNVEPTGPRPTGSQMAAALDGNFIGFLSGGCIETALVEEARLAFEDGENCSIRYGVNSPYMDIIDLPCGSSIDVYIDTKIADAIVDEIIASLEKRKAIRLITDMETGESRTEPMDGADDRPQLILDGQTFDRLYRPPLKLVVAGKGPLLASAAEIATQTGMDVTMITTEDALAVHGKALGAEVRKTVQNIEIDLWTAVAVVFHEHELEGPVLSAALNSDAFYIGALGSRSTHADRTAQLMEGGWSKDDIARIHGPMGISIGSRNPPEIAISAIAEILKVYRERFPV